MEREIKEYLHLYIGCECDLIKTDNFHFPHRVTLDYGLCGNAATFPKDYIVKPILRPLKSMIEAEALECWKTTHRIEEQKLEGWQVIDYYRSETCFYQSCEFHYLLSKNFDLFGLIESGLAIEKTV